MSGRTVTSLTNPTVKAVRALHLRKERDETGRFVAEGLKAVIEGIETGRAPAILLHGLEAAGHPLTKVAVAATLAAKGEVIEVTQEILAKVSRRDNPQAVVGVFRQAFAAKGRFVPYLEKVPVRVILNDRAALLGAAGHAASLAAE